MAAALLADGPLVLTNAPDLADIATMRQLLVQHGLTVEHDKTARTLTLSGAATSLEAPYDIVRKMRASVLVLGPLLARFGKARVSLPGGCAIGTRPVDLHLKGLEQLGAEVEITAGYIEARAPQGKLRGAKIIFPQVSVGATENLLMAACLAEGETELVNAAREPEITDLAMCLMRMGARIEGIGTGTLRIEGGASLLPATHPIVPDRIEAGTYACAAAITGGTLHLQGARLEHLGSVARVLRDSGVDVAETISGLTVSRLNGLRGADVMTEPFPGFATDMQAQFMALMAVAEGASMITETIFENRFMHVPELMRMGARINFHGTSAIVRGVPKLSGAPVMATDLRASVSLILAGLAAEGETIVNRVYHLDRGYEHVEQKLAAVGAKIERLAN
jgi:UDP-N-acetylglucosamine 1-carboxyvinyltransferase